MAGDDLTWIKASRSMSTGACVELTVDDGLVCVRNSRDPGLVLRFTRAEMSAFLEGTANHEFDHLVE